MAANVYLTEAERGILENAVIGIVGAGGLGSNCAMHLVRAGVRRLRICDFDVVGESNLNRQFYFRDQVGAKKVVALGENLRRIEPSLDLDLRDVRLEPSSAPAFMAGCDVVVEAADCAEAKAMVIAAAVAAGKRLVTASGMAGWGRSGAMGARRMGPAIVAVGDGETEVAADLPPQSPRVGIAAAMQANSVISMLLGKEI